MTRGEIMRMWREKMTDRELVDALRSTTSRSKRKLLDAAADRIESTIRARTTDEVKYYPARMNHPNLCRPLTNADRIRQMSDEELAAWAINEAPKIGFRYTSSETGLLKWLKQPAEEG